MTNPTWTLIGFQDRLIDRLDHIEGNGVGLHRNRSAGAAKRNARLELVRRGYGEQQAAAIVRDAVGVFELRQLCDGTDAE
jgi:hypothetical protein